MAERFQIYEWEGVLWWRLSGGNNRTMARSASGFFELAQARSDLQEVAHLLGSSQIAVIGESGMNWWWRLQVQGELRAVSVHRYGRRIECLKAFERFRAAMERGDVPVASGILRPRQSRSATHCYLK